MQICTILQESLSTWGTPRHLKRFLFCSSSTHITLYQVPYTYNSVPQLITQLPISQPLNQLVWSPFGTDQNYPDGILLTGSQLGTVCVYDVSKLIQGESGLLCEENLWDQEVCSMEVNPFKNNLVAVAGAQEVLIFNLEGNIKEPQIFSPGSPNLHENDTGKICAVSWNKKLPHILASADTNGFTVVWDLKTNKPIFNFQGCSNQGEIQVSLVWNPEMPTQICVGYQDESETQIWDLRQSQSPVIQFENSSGVVSLDWCPQDPNLLLIATQYQVSYWNYRNAQKLGQLQLQEPIKEVRFSNIPGSFSITFEQHVEVYLLKPSHVEGLMFKWLRKTTGAQFSNSGKLSVFQNGNIKEYQFIPEKNMVYEQLQNFQQNIEDDHKNVIQNLANEEQGFYQYLNAKNQGNEALLTLWGFNRKEILAGAEQISGKNYGQQQEEKKIVKKQQPKFNFGAMNEADAENFFDQLGTQKKTETIQTKKPVKNDENEIIQQENIQKNINWNAGIERVIKKVKIIFKNLLIGNYEGAVDCALKAGRATEAILIAIQKDSSLLENAIEQWFASQQDNFLRTFFKNFVQNKTDDFAKTTPLDNWTEVVAYALNNMKDKNNYTEILNNLADRFIKEKKDYNYAVNCYLLADNLSGIIKVLFLNKIFNLMIDSQKDNNQKNIILIKSVEKIYFYLKSNQNLSINQQTQEILDKICVQFSQLSNIYQMNFLAYSILQKANEQNQEVLVQKNWIYHQTNDSNFFQIFKNPPPASFKIENIKIENVKKSLVQPQKDQRKTPIQGQKVFNDIPQVKQPIIGPPVQNQVVQDKNKPFSSQPFKGMSTQIQSEQLNTSQQPQQGPPKQTQPVLVQPKQQPVPFRPSAPIINQNQQVVPQQFNNNNIQPLKQPEQNNRPIQQLTPNLPPPKRPSSALQEQQSIKSSQEIQYQNNKPQIEPLQKNIPFVPQQFNQQQNQVQQNFSQVQEKQNCQESPQKTFKYQVPQQVQEYIQNILQKNKAILSKIEVIFQQQSNQKRRQDLETQLDSIFEMMTNGQILQKTVENVQNICKQQNQSQAALNIFTQITKEDWESNKIWLMPLKRILMKR